MDVSELFSIPTPRHPTTTRCSRAICFLNSSYFFNASIVTFSKKKKFGKKKRLPSTLDPRHGTLALDLEPSTLDPRQKDRLVSFRRGMGSKQAKYVNDSDANDASMLKDMPG